MRPALEIISNADTGRWVRAMADIEHDAEPLVTPAATAAAPAKRLNSFVIPPGPWRWDGYVLRDASNRSILFAEEIGPRVALRCDRNELQTALDQAGAMQAVIGVAPLLFDLLSRVHQHGLADEYPGLATAIEQALAAAGAAE